MDFLDICDLKRDSWFSEEGKEIVQSLKLENDDKKIENLIKLCYLRGFFDGKEASEEDIYDRKS